MKKLIIISIAIFLLSFSKESKAQCPGCIIDTTCQPAGGFGVCPDDTIKLYAYADTSVNITFIIPTQYDDPGTGITVDVNWVEVNSITGLPIGLNWECNNMPTCHYNGGTNGCALICGTPISSPGIYHTTVNLDADVSVVGNTTTSFEMIFEILPSNSGNFGFNFTPTQGCLPLTVDFTNNIPSNGDTNYTYLWDFGNGFQSTLESPTPQTYDTAGMYEIGYTVTIDTADYFLSGITVLGASCNDDPFSDPDFYFVLKESGVGIYTSSAIIDDAAPTYISAPNVVLDDLTYTIEVWDEDGGLGGSDDACGSVDINGHTAGTYTISSGSLSVQVEVSHPVVQIDEIDTIFVYDNPAIPTISIFPNDSVCEGDLLTLTSSSSQYNQWFNQNGIIPMADSVVYEVAQSGGYYVQVANTNGCYSISGTDSLVIVDNPNKPTFWIIYDTLNTNSSEDLQWYFYNDVVGEAIPSANANQLDVNESGFYYLVATNDFGCVNTSDTVYVTAYGINDNFTDFNVKVYPNPASTELTIKFDNNIGVENINIYNVYGQLTYTEKINTYNVESIINLENHKKGVYLIKFIARNKIITKKLIVN